MGVLWWRLELAAVVNLLWWGSCGEDGVIVVVDMDYRDGGGEL